MKIFKFILTNSILVSTILYNNTQAMDKSMMIPAPSAINNQNHINENSILQYLLQEDETVRSTAKHFSANGITFDEVK